MKITKVITKDGSATYHDSEYDETYHSTTGALEESDKKYAKTCNIAFRKNVKILDICFGLGYNSAAAIDSFSGDNIEIVGLEIYDGIIDEIIALSEEYPFKCRKIMQKAAKEKEYSDNNIKIKIIMGDARKMIKNLPQNYFDCVFLDPFSPKKCPELWTSDFFSDIYSVMKKKGILTTYSCARIVRDNLKSAGFLISDGPCVGRRAPSTIAIKN